MSMLNFTAAIDLEAAGEQRKFRILAYTGGVLRVSGFDAPVVVDLQGLEAIRSVPVVLDHKVTTANTVGQTSDIANDGRQLVLTGPVTGQSDQVRNVIAQADKGFAWQASIGCEVKKREEVPPGKRVSVNGQTFTGPVIVARRSQLLETSVLPVGADSSTNVNLAASSAPTKESSVMTFDDYILANGFSAETLTADGKEILQASYDRHHGDHAGDLTDLRESRAADHERIRKVEIISAGYPQITATAVREGWSEQKTELAVLKSQANRNSPSPYSFSKSGPSETDVLCASFAMTAGGSDSFLAESFGEDVVDAASRIEARGATIRTVMDHVLKAAGVHESSNKVTDSYIRATFEASRKLEASGLSSMSLPGILSNAANKLLLEGYQSVPTTWQEFCAVGNLNDFKVASRYRMIAGGEFEEIADGGQIKHMVLGTEQTYTNQAKTYAKMVSLGRQAIINDDLSAFDAIPRSLGRMAVLKLEKLVYSLLMGNAAGTFAAGNGNLLTGASSALSIDSLSESERKFLNRTDENGDPVLLTPQIVLVPTSLSVTANQLVRDTQVVAVGVSDSSAVTPSGNPHAGRFRTVVSPWMENEKLAGSSETKWFLIAPPQGTSGLIEVGFLNGMASPTIDSSDLDFNQLGMELRGYWDFGVNWQDGRYGVQNDGAA